MYYVPTDIYVGGALSKYGEYSYLEAELLRKLVRGGLMIDVGANMGAHTIAVANTGAQVLAIEPQPLFARLIRCSALINNYSTVRVLEAVCGDTPGEVNKANFTYKDTNNYGAYGRDNEHFVGKGTPMVRLDDLYTAYNLQECSVIKIDVEGMELDVLRGTEDLTKKQHPFILVEADRENMVAPLVRFAESHDYTAFWVANFLYNPNNFFRDTENIFPNTCSIDLLFQPKDYIMVQGLKQAKESDTLSSDDLASRCLKNFIY